MESCGWAELLPLGMRTPILLCHVFIPVQDHRLQTAMSPLQVSDHVVQTGEQITHRDWLRCPSASFALQFGDLYLVIPERAHSLQGMSTSDLQRVTRE